ncbi:MAG TPA: hypothetical protein EYP43_04470 [Thermoplasmata archaeon]|nr:hypothetical protein [Thermoplasmata archaeon]
MPCAEILRNKGRYVPDLVMAGGFVNETQMFKAMAMSNLGDGPLIRAIAMARAPITAVFKGDHFSKLAREGNLPRKFAEEYGTNPEQFFITAPDLRHMYPEATLGEDIPWSAVALYTYFTERLGTGLKQLMAGSRKFRLNLLSRTDIAALTPRAAEITGLTLIDQLEIDQMEQILDY